jgi:hypothetical protein
LRFQKAMATLSTGSPGEGEAAAVEVALEAVLLAGALGADLLDLRQADDLVVDDGAGVGVVEVEVAALGEQVGVLAVGVDAALDV